MKKYKIECPTRKSNSAKYIVKSTKEHKKVPNKLNRKFKQWEKY